MTSPIVDGLLGGLFAGLATGLGALAVYSVPERSLRANELLPACAAGVMLAASLFSLLAPGIEVARARAGSAGAAALLACPDHSLRSLLVRGPAVLGQAVRGG